MVIKLREQKIGSDSNKVRQLYCKNGGNFSCACSFNSLKKYLVLLDDSFCTTRNNDEPKDNCVKKFFIPDFKV